LPAIIDLGWSWFRRHRWLALSLFDALLNRYIPSVIGRLPLSLSATGQDLVHFVDDLIDWNATTGLTGHTDWAYWLRCLSGDDLLTVLLHFDSLLDGQVPAVICWLCLHWCHWGWCCLGGLGHFVAL